MQRLIGLDKSSSSFSFRARRDEKDMAATAAIPMTASRVKTRSALIASADISFRERLSSVLNGLRWHVREADGGAQAWGEAMDALPQTIIVDSWLPDLDVSEFLKEFRTSFPNVDVVTTGNASPQESSPGPHRQEILYALRRIQDTDTAAWNTAPELGDPGNVKSQNPDPPSSTASWAEDEKTIAITGATARRVVSLDAVGNAPVRSSSNHVSGFRSWLVMRHA
jgi:CheY-like chemotaxis protein